ncbi:uncharacterized protein LOC112904996 [Agrilus planipennis]|uniref:Uncharacterized protein LOC112904996 n=1 Tax=Agrilus planipennis TaxID=224129 RepID=A0A7F5R8E4_AGRPL|nr:uncharacterized protein LOC112904996 [Agrilus planipennis]
MPSSEGCRYCLTMVDRYSRWPEAVPIPDQEAATVARAFYSNWIARFGTPLRITSDQGRQFESYVFKQLNRLLGTTHLRTTAYHPSANGMVERLHRQLKAAIMCHQTSSWTRTLPTVLLGIRSAWKEDLQATTAELLYGETLRLPGEFLGSHPDFKTHEDASEFVKELRTIQQQLRPTQERRHGDRKTFIFKDLGTTNQVFIRRGGPKESLQQPYEGPYAVVQRADKTFVVNVKGRDVTVSVDRLKPAYVIAEPPATSRNEDIPASVEMPPQLPSSEPTITNQTTRAGRRVRFPDRLQAGFP